MNWMSFPEHRPRRLRQSATLRDIVQETHLHVSDFIQPIFVIHGSKTRRAVPSMPGVEQLTLDCVLDEVRSLANLGVKAVLLFGIPRKKDALGSEAYAHQGIIQKTIRSLKHEIPNMLLITDVCFCEYTDHGHCGVVDKDGQVDNDKTLELLAKEALSHAEAGADIVAPSDMMDGRVAAIRKTLDKGGFSGLPILSYSAKYASAFYGPFREAAESAPRTGDRKGYQINPANRREALREIALDLEEGADMVMVKPALAYLDIIRDVKEHFNAPVAAYNVSGEYAMVKAAAMKGWIDERAVRNEMLLSIKRAGADMIISYFTKEIVKDLKNGL